MWICFHPDGREIALALITVGGRAALLNYLCSSPSAQTTFARWFLSGEVIRDLIGRGVRHIIADRVEDTSDGNMYFQQRLGYAPMILDVVRRPISPTLPFDL